MRVGISSHLQKEYDESEKDFRYHLRQMPSLIVADRIQLAIDQIEQLLPPEIQLVIENPLQILKGLVHAEHFNRGMAEFKLQEARERRSIAWKKYQQELTASQG